MTTDAVERVDCGAVRGGDHTGEQSTRRRAGDVITAVEDEAERIRQREVDETIRRLEGDDGFTERQREIVASMADAILDRLLDTPRRRLAVAAVTDEPAAVEVARRMFAPELGTGDRSPPAPAGGPEVTSGDD